MSSLLHRPHAKMEHAVPPHASGYLPSQPSTPGDPRPPSTPKQFMQSAFPATMLSVSFIQNPPAPSWLEENQC